MPSHRHFYILVLVSGSDFFLSTRSGGRHGSWCSYSEAKESFSVPVPRRNTFHHIRDMFK